LRKQDRDQPRPIEFGIQTARLCQIAVRAGELRDGEGGLKNNILVENEEKADGTRGGEGIGYHGMRLKLTLNDFSTLRPYGVRAAELMTREGRVLNFNVFNPEYQIFGHFSRPTWPSRRPRRASLG